MSQLSQSSIESDYEDGRSSTPQKRKLDYNFWKSDSDSDTGSPATKKMLLAPPAQKKIDQLVTGN